MLNAPIQTTEGSQVREVLQRQTEMVKVLSNRAKELRTSKDARPKKIDKLRAFLGDTKNNLRTIDPPMLLPLDARVSIAGITPEKSTVFKSNLFPLLLHFEKVDSETAYPVIFKNGDDMRQDQLVIQLFTLMDRLLRNENLDLCLTPYKVLATGPLEGMAQYIESITLAAVLAQHGGSLLNFLRFHHPDESSTSTFGVNGAVFDTYIRSCAGYCVVTYLLGVGDRHLDNLLLAPDGHFFHGEPKMSFFSPALHSQQSLTLPSQLTLATSLVEIPSLSRLQSRWRRKWWMPWEVQLRRTIPASKSYATRHLRACERTQTSS